jgi:hypothetical protein
MAGYSMLAARAAVMNCCVHPLAGVKQTAGEFFACARQHVHGCQVSD